MEDRTRYTRLKHPDLLKAYMFVKTNPIDFVFEGHGELFVYAKFKGKTNVRFQVELKNIFDEEGSAWGERDCTVGNFDLNFFFRTEKGRVGGRYKTMKLMMSAIKKGLAQMSAEGTHYEIIFKDIPPLRNV